MFITSAWMEEECGSKSSTGGLNKAEFNLTSQRSDRGNKIFTQCVSHDPIFMQLKSTQKITNPHQCDA